jgi:flagellar biosynthesis GTPase FlhF
LETEEKLTEQDINDIIAGLQELQKDKPKPEKQPSAAPSSSLYIKELEQQHKQRFSELQYLMADTFNGLILELKEQAQKPSPINVDAMQFNNNEQLQDWFINQLPKASYGELLALFEHWKKHIKTAKALSSSHWEALFFL